MFISFYIGQYWYIFSDSIHLFNEGAETEEVEIDDKYFLYYPGNWSLKEMAHPKRVIVSMYFSFTSLSTVGFGDYYPVSDNERLWGAFLLLFGVAIFSYIMGELMEMISKVRNIEGENSREDDLEKFF